MIKDTWHYKYRYFAAYVLTLLCMLVAVLFGKLDGSAFAAAVTGLFTALVGGGAVARRRPQERAELEEPGAA